jgi:hypothetical protein
MWKGCPLRISRCPEEVLGSSDFPLSGNHVLAVYD